MIVSPLRWYKTLNQMYSVLLLSSIMDIIQVRLGVLVRDSPKGLRGEASPRSA